MAANDAFVLSAVAKCFSSVPDEEWASLTSDSTWDEFLSASRNALEGGRAFGDSEAPIARIRRQTPFSDFLAEKEVDALFCPPSAEEKRAFAARHFTGGLPASALPVESLYVAWSDTGMFAGEHGLYNSDAARYMRDLAQSLGAEIPREFADCPDHLSIELEIAVLLMDLDMVEDARRFVVERFAWLGAYRSRLIEIGPEATFYLALVDLLIGIRACQMSFEAEKSA